jgi:LysR family transcriptional regulator, transcriptional activator of the cysJI operon
MRDRLRIFSVVANKLNFTQAAQVLFMTQPAVSSAIKALEAEYGLPLFSRAGGRVQLTDAGRVLLGYADRIHLLEEEAVKDIKAMSANIQGTLTIGASTTIAQYILPRIIGDFAARYPQVAFTLVSQITEQMIQLTKDGAVDVAVVEGDVSGNVFNASMWMTDELLLNTVDDGHAPESVTFEELLSLPLLMREHGTGHRQSLETAFRSRGVEMSALNIALTLGSSEAVKQAIEGGLGYGFLSEWACKKERALGILKVVPVQNFRVQRQFHILQTKQSENTSLVQRFVAFLNDVAMDKNVAPH